MHDDMDIDHYEAAKVALANAEDGFEFLDKKDLAFVYAQLGIGHALVRIADALDWLAHHADEANRRGARQEDRQDRMG